MEDSPESQREEASQSLLTSIPPNPPAPIPKRHHLPVSYPWFLALLGLLFLIVVSSSSTWPSRVQPMSQPTPTPRIGTMQTPILQLGTAMPFLCNSGALTIMGSPTLQPLVAAVAKDYSARCSGASITVEGGGNYAGLANLETGHAGIVDSDLPASGQYPESENLVDHQVDIAIFGIVVNPDTGVTNLTTAQLRGIYSGHYTNWSQLGGANLSIRPVPLPDYPIPRTVFERYILGQFEKIMVEARSPPPDVVYSMKALTIPGAIGYTRLDLVPLHSDFIHVIAINGWQPTTINVETNNYSFWNIEHMYTRGQPTPLEQALLDFMGSPDGRAEASTYHCVSMVDLQPFTATLAAHNAVPLPQP